MGRMPDGELAHWEKHLLTCDECRRQAAEAEEYVAAMRRALQRLSSEPPQVSRIRKPKPGC